MGYDRVRTEYKLERTIIGTSDPVIVEADIGILLIALVFPGVATTAKVQTTLSPDADIEAETAVWADWDEGTVAVYTEAVAYSPNGIRLVNSGSGPVIMLVRGNYS